MAKKMEKGKHIISMVIYFLKENIKMDKKMEKGKNIMKATCYMKENI